MLAVKKKVVVKKEVVKKAVVKRAVAKKATTKKASTKEATAVAEEVKAAPPKKVVKVVVGALNCGMVGMQNCCSGTYMTSASGLASNFYCKVDYDDGSSVEVGRKANTYYAPEKGATRKQIEDLPQEVFAQIGKELDMHTALITATTVLKYAGNTKYEGCLQDVASAILARCGFEQVKVLLGNYGNTICLWARVRDNRKIAPPQQ